MREFFRGWKRKAGCVTLALACLFTVALVRGSAVGDMLTLNGKFNGEIKSSNGYVKWALWDHRPIPAPRPAFVHESYSTSGGNHVHGEDDPAVLWRFHSWVLGWGDDDGSDEFSLPRGYRIGYVSYWSFIVPLTLLSAYLLFSKARPKTRPAESN